MTAYALLFTDIVDSTQAVERLGDAAAGQLWIEHDRRARELIRRFDGREIDRTDGFFTLFDDVAQAVRFALAYHEIVANLSLSARVGVHFADVRLRANPEPEVVRGAKPVEVEGLAKPLAARIMALAQGGQTLLSAAAIEALGNSESLAAEVRRHGHYRLKGIESPTEIYEIGRPGSAAFAPPADTERAYRVIRQGEQWQPVKEVSNNLPAERDEFVGRTGELRELAERLDDGTRLLTVVGPGGAGKTRVARRYGRAWMGDWPGGVYFCDLSESRSIDGICFAVASALQLQLGRVDPVVQIGHAIAGRGRCLMILDNFEQVAEHAEATLGQWLDRSGHASFIVTSRHSLHLNGELLLHLSPLELTTDSVRLFCLRAAALRRDFDLTAANRAAIESIVALLDGLPLAIELAAARIPALSPVQLLDRLKDRFWLLAATRPTGARQSTLRNAIDWSWSLLSAHEQAALAQCAVFEGGFDLAAAEAVIQLGTTAGDRAPPALDIIQGLVDKSLLRVWQSAGQGRYDIDEPYFGMYLSIREYARERLHEAGSEVERTAEDRHGLHFAGLGSDRAIEALSSHGGVHQRHLLIEELDNLVVACRRAIATSALDVALGCWRAVWEVVELRGPVSIAAELGRLLLNHRGLTGKPLLVALTTMALVLHRSGRTPDAADCLERAYVLSRSLGETLWEGRVLGQRGALRRDQGEIEAARGDFEAGLSLHRTSGDRRLESATQGSLGNLCLQQGRMDDARHHYEAALTIAEETGNRRVAGSVLGNLGLLHQEQGRTQEGFDHYTRALAVHREVGSRSFEGSVLGNLGLLRFEQGFPDEAKAHYESALAIHRAVGNRRDEGIVLSNLGELLFAKESLDDARDCYESALAIAREIGYRRLEGGALGELGALLGARGEVRAARLALEKGETILRELGDQVALGKLLCVRGHVELDVQCLQAAVSCMRAAESIAEQTGAGPESELGTRIASLRTAMADGADPLRASPMSPRED